MKKKGLVFMILVSAVLFSLDTAAQCSICTKTAQQLGEGPAKGLNAGIVYLAFLPLAIGSFIFFRWRKDNREA